MQQIAPGKRKTAHYASAIEIMNLGLLIPSALSGFISNYLGRKRFFLWVMIATIPLFLVTWLVPVREVEEGMPTPK